MSQTDARGAVTRMIYDTARDIVTGSKVKEKIDPLGYREYFAHDRMGNLIRYRPYSEWTTAPVYMAVAGVYYYYLNDHLGTPQQLLNSLGIVVWEATYESFGSAYMENGAVITNSLRFAGQYYDFETGMHYNWNRYYDPSIGRYYRTDPMEDGINIYIYAMNSPLLMIDTNGLQSKEGEFGVENSEYNGGNVFFNPKFYAHNVGKEYQLTGNLSKIIIDYEYSEPVSLYDGIAEIINLYTPVVIPAKVTRTVRVLNEYQAYEVTTVIDKRSLVEVMRTKRPKNCDDCKMWFEESQFGFQDHQYMLFKPMGWEIRESQENIRTTIDALRIDFYGIYFKHE